MDLNLIKDILKKFHEDQSIDDVLSISVEPSPIAQHVSKTKLEVKLGDGRTAKKSFIIKTNSEAPLTKRLLGTYKLMEKEISMYGEMIPAMEKLMDQRRDTKEKIWCKLIGYRNDMIILEDLTNYGYRTINMLDCLDYEQVILTVCTLGRFHAISKVFFKTDVEEEKINKFRNYPLFGNSVMLDMFTTGGLITLSQVMKKSWGSDWFDIADRLNKAASTTEEYFKKLLQNPIDEMDVLNHGDLWCCNVMFQYHDFQDIPIRAKFVDFQLSHYNSLAWDLTFLLYSSVRPSLRRESLSKILDSYFKAFSDTLDFYGYEGTRPTRKSVGEEMDRFKYMGMTALCSAYTITTTSKNTFTMKPLLQEKGPRLCYFPFIYETAQFMGDVQEDLRDFAREGLF